MPGPGAGSTPGHRIDRGTRCGDGAGPVSASGRERRFSLGDKSLEQPAMVPGRAKGRTVTPQQSPVLAPHPARGTGARGDRATLQRTRSSARLPAKHLLLWGFCPPQPSWTVQSPLPHTSCPAIPAGFQLWVSLVVTAGPWRDQTNPGVMEATPEAKGGFRQGTAGPSWLSPWTLGGHSPLF